MTDIDGEWVITDHGANVAMGHAWQYARIACAQVARVVDPADGMSQVPDAYQAVKAIRNVRRAACMAVQHLTDAAAKKQLREALADFDQAHKHVGEVRNILEHFDDYALGVGHLQQPTRKPRKREPSEELARRFRVHFEWIDGDPQRPRVRVGSYSVDLAEAAQTASLLPFEIWAAIKSEEGDPVPRSYVAALATPVKRSVIPSPPTWVMGIVKAAAER